MCCLTGVLQPRTKVRLASNTTGLCSLCSSSLKSIPVLICGKILLGVGEFPDRILNELQGEIERLIFATLLDGELDPGSFFGNTGPFFSWAEELFSKPFDRKPLDAPIELLRMPFRRDVNSLLGSLP